MGLTRNSIIVFLVLFSGCYLLHTSSSITSTDDSPVLLPATAGISDAETKALSFGSPSSAVSAIKGFLSGIFGSRDSAGSDEPKLTILSGKRHFELHESPSFEFEYSGAGNAAAQNRNHDKITGFLVAGTETVWASLYDSSGRLLDDKPIIETSRKWQGWFFWWLTRLVLPAILAAVLIGAGAEIYEKAPGKHIKHSEKKVDNE